MTYGEFSDKIADLDTDTIIACCKDIYIWRENDTLPKDSILNVLCEDCGLHTDNDWENLNVRILENIIMQNAHKRFKYIVPLLLKDNPGKYIK